MLLGKYCTKESKTCKALFKKEDLPKGKECVASPAGGPKWASPRGGPKWKVPESVPKEDQKEAKALANLAGAYPVRWRRKGILTPYRKIPEIRLTGKLQ